MVHASVAGTLILSLLSSLAAAAPSAHAARKLVKESVNAPRGWTKRDDVPVPADYPLRLRIGLPQARFDELERHLYEVSNPTHGRYGQHLSKVEVESLVAPHKDSLNAVDAWLASHGITSDSMHRSPAQDWVTIVVPVSVAEEMLDTTYHVWTHDESGDALIRTTSWSLPEHVHNHVDVIQPTTYFSRPQAHRSTALWAGGVTEDLSGNFGTITTASGASVNASCNSTITLSCLRELYSVGSYKPTANNSNEIAITGYLGQYVNNADLESFYEEYVPSAVGTQYKTVSVNDGQNSQNISEAGTEANLDSQYAFGLTYGITPETFYTTGGSPPYIPDVYYGDTNNNEPYVDWLNYVLNQTSLPQTISTSYGDTEQTVPESYAKRACQGFAQLGARGVSVIFSSGDSGVGDGNPDPATQQCFTNDGTNKTVFMPAFPAGCPYVTSVGATFQINPEVAVGIPEIDYYSGGGFSNYFARPWYQEVAVEGYLLYLGNEHQGLYNKSGRGYPDVSAQGWNFHIFYEGQEGLIGGTSAAAPTFAGIVSLLNDARLNDKLPSLGFLNPLLYTVGWAGLTDVTSGSNPGCGTGGFNATYGWDPVTGLGTPNFATLKEITSVV